MRGFCGWYDRTAQGDLQPRLRGMAQGPGVDVATLECRLAGPAALAVHGKSARPVLLEHDGIAMAIAGHARLIRGTARIKDPAAIAAALRAEGAGAFASLGGDFALAAWDSTRQRGWLAIDRIGVHPLFYARCGDALVFATSIDGVCGHPAVPRSLDTQAVFDYLYHHVCPGPGTIVAGVRRLMPGQCIEFGPGVDAEPRTYWSMQFAERPGIAVEERAHRFKALLEDAVRESAEGAHTGAFLSGGTDSSTVNGMLGRVTGAPARSFSIGFDVPGYDETEYARIAARHFGCQHVEYYVKPADVVEAVPLIATSYDQPFGNASAVPAYLCARHAREQGVERLLAGDGGDELFGGNERYAKQHLLGHYQRLPASLRGAVLEPLLLSTPLGALPGIRKVRSYVEQARPTMPQRYESYNLLTHLGTADVLTPEFLGSIDPHHPAHLLAEAHAPFARHSLINQMLAIDLRFVMADGDLPKVMHTCNLAGIDVTFPLLDDRIVDFSQELPADLKLRGTQLRWFFKHALADFLPQQILTKKKHGFGLPVGQWLLSHRPLHDLARDSVQKLLSRGIVRAEFVADLFEHKLPQHPGYFGTMVWVLMMLSLWLDSRRL
jgi:asparagine synthase (glutamine-hydrolysing)